MDGSTHALSGRRPWLVGLLLAAAGLAAWWYRQPGPAPDTATATAGTTPDYVVEGLTAVTMDEFGRPQRRLTTPRLRHYAEADSSELDTPQLVLLEEGAPPWIVRSERGRVLDNGDEVVLQGAVRAERAAFGSNEAVTLTTSELLILPDVHYAESDQPVRLESGRDWIDASEGMRLWFAEPMRTQLFGRARALMHVAESATTPADAAVPP
ncbi:LPS export ABC transporter periplasmic protein LptC [Thiohalocapsa marina]|uniref:LPS export ABC transporter periplasmic protein LptC n=1 Tax=Thiohalocapsa marina TaxID=424902 RepID=A0A5M8FMT8_9GAMM|nr:LPS export ABC transporter periplasmic protein LptC [Thiohalocapsa marina]KAA6186039.1 LPS export ABC transporter periplasmic protein LptC [Thiohalocapsa marina]